MDEKIVTNTTTIQIIRFFAAEDDKDYFEVLPIIAWGIERLGDGESIIYPITIEICASNMREGLLMADGTVVFPEDRKFDNVSAAQEALRYELQQLNKPRPRKPLPPT